MRAATMIHEAQVLVPGNESIDPSFKLWEAQLGPVAVYGTETGGGDGNGGEGGGGGVSGNGGNMETDQDRGTRVTFAEALGIRVTAFVTSEAAIGGGGEDPNKGWQ